MDENQLRDSWCTPEWLWQAVLTAFGIDRFDLDPCSNEWSTVLAETRYTAEDDGLKQDWGDGIVWCNPPYSQPLQREFAEKCRAHRGIAALLIPFAPATAMWREVIAGPGVIIPRLEFTPPPGIKASSPGPVPHALMLCGRHVDKDEIWTPGIDYAWAWEARDLAYHLRHCITFNRHQTGQWVIT